MNRSRFILLSALLALASLPVGCATVETRIKENPALFASLPADTQARLRRGEIIVGDTKDMVYIALGPPDRRFQRIDATGVTKDIWSYAGSYYTRESYWPRYHIHRRHFEDGFFFHGPEYVDVRHEYEHLRIEFAEEKVLVIEQRVQ